MLSYPTEVLDITLDLNGHTIKGDGTTVAVVFNLGSNQAKGSTITIKDSSGNDSGKITGGKGGVKLDGKDCTLKFEGGTITGNHGSAKGGGIFMGATSKLVMTVRVRKDEEVKREQVAKETSAGDAPLTVKGKGVVSKNALCPCGSGKKYTRCCGKDLED